jgi:broad specificity phosphatase PhoE
MANRLLYLARHGESEAAQAANPGDGELTAIGRQQSELLGKRLHGIPFAAIHHSPWTRAVQTAAIVAEHLPGVPCTHRTSCRSATRRYRIGSG